ncbi:NAD-dependent epimerase/dehydratase family protein [Sinorhizobium fredii]|uniref:NAD-dependent epimerase/dehydratase family protein n=1 Tax=Rhizobium fredii TaxID=380 RepID=UPI001181A7AD|nr:NAD-dependent epimerase/dehydratase family protein [Sinorhizobium fredii]
MRTLVVGGTGFLGGAIAETAAGAGHEVTILSRGETRLARRNACNSWRSLRFAQSSAE